MGLYHDIIRQPCKRYKQGFNFQGVVPVGKDMANGIAAVENIEKHAPIMPAPA